MYKWESGDYTTMICKHKTHSMGYSGDVDTVYIVHPECKLYSVDIGEPLVVIEDGADYQYYHQKISIYGDNILDFGNDYQYLKNIEWLSDKIVEYFGNNPKDFNRKLEGLKSFVEKFIDENKGDID